jgi:hypothetical protein
MKFKQTAGLNAQYTNNNKVQLEVTNKDDERKQFVVSKEKGEQIYSSFRKKINKINKAHHIIIATGLTMMTISLGAKLYNPSAATEYNILQKELNQTELTLKSANNSSQWQEDKRKYNELEKKANILFIENKRYINNKKAVDGLASIANYLCILAGAAGISQTQIANGNAKKETRNLIYDLNNK